MALKGESRQLLLQRERERARAKYNIIRERGPSSIEIELDLMVLRVSEIKAFRCSRHEYYWEDLNLYHINNEIGLDV